MLNLLIAILSNIFTEIRNSTNMEKTSIMYDSYLSRRWNKYWSFLVIVPSPLSIINFPLLFLTHFIPKKINKLTVKIVYLFVLIC